MKIFLCIFLIICAKIIKINSYDENDAGSTDIKGKQKLDANELDSKENNSSGSESSDEPFEASSSPISSAEEYYLNVAEQQNPTPAEHIYHQQSPQIPRKIRRSQTKRQPRIFAGEKSALKRGKTFWGNKNMALRLMI